MGGRGCELGTGVGGRRAKLWRHSSIWGGGHPHLGGWGLRGACRGAEQNVGVEVVETGELGGEGRWKWGGNGPD